MRWLACFLAAWLVLPAAGCALHYRDVGRPVPQPAGLEIGVTTKQAALARLGPPLLVRRQFDGEMFSYRRTMSQVRQLTIVPILLPLFFYSDGKTARDDLTLLFDRQGVLVGIGYETDDSVEDP